MQPWIERRGLTEDEFEEIAELMQAETKPERRVKIVLASVLITVLMLGLAVRFVLVGKGVPSYLANGAIVFTALLVSALFGVVQKEHFRAIHERNVLAQKDLTTGIVEVHVYQVHRTALLEGLSREEDVYLIDLGTGRALFVPARDIPDSRQLGVPQTIGIPFTAFSRTRLPIQYSDQRVTPQLRLPPSEAVVSHVAMQPMFQAVSPAYHEHLKQIGGSSGPKPIRA